MKILILYGTTEGQTAKVANFIAESIANCTDAVTVIDAAAADDKLDPGAFDAVILAASLHAGHYQAEVKQFARTHHETLNTKPSAFVSVSLSAASSDPDDREGLARCVRTFLDETLWAPVSIHHVAGAFRFTRYDFLKRWALRYIAWQRGQSTDTCLDHELTDWRELGAFAGRFMDGIRPTGFPSAG